MRCAPLAAALAVVLAACSPSADVIVSRADQAAPPGDGSVAPPLTTAPKAAPATTTEPAPGTRPEPDPTLQVIDPDPPPASLPPASVPVEIPAGDGDQRPFPPAGDEWSDHELADLAPAPDDLGPGWTFRRGSVSEARPPDPDDAIPGCDVAPPPILDGIDLDYDGRDGGAALELELSVWRGDDDDAEAVMSAFERIPECELDDLGLETDLEVVELGRADVDDSLVMIGRTAFAESSGTIALVLARVGGTVVIAYVGALAGDPGSGEAFDHAVVAVGAVLDRL